VVFGPRNRNILTIGYDKSVRFWSLDANQAKLTPRRQFSLPDRPAQVILALSPDWLAIKLDPSFVDFDDPSAPKPRSESKTSILLHRLEFKGGKATESTLTDSETLPVENALVSPDGRWLVTGLWEHGLFSKTGQDAYARVYDLTRRRSNSLCSASGTYQQVDGSSDKSGQQLSRDGKRRIRKTKSIKRR
jgi:hypothetical protein